MRPLSLFRSCAAWLSRTTLSSSSPVMGALTASSARSERVEITAALDKSRRDRINFMGKLILRSLLTPRQRHLFKHPPAWTPSPQHEPPAIPSARPHRAHVGAVPSAHHQRPLSRG